LLSVKFSYKENAVCNCCRNIEHFPFRIRPFALHRQQPQKVKQNFDISPPGKIYADAHGYRFNNSSLSMQVLRCVHSTEEFKRMVKQ